MEARRKWSCWGMLGVLDNVTLSDGVGCLVSLDNVQWLGSLYRKDLTVQTEEMPIVPVPADCYWGMIFYCHHNWEVFDHTTLKYGPNPPEKAGNKICKKPPRQSLPDSLTCSSKYHGNFTKSEQRNCWFTFQMMSDQLLQHGEWGLGSGPCEWESIIRDLIIFKYGHFPGPPNFLQMSSLCHSSPERWESAGPVIGSSPNERDCVVSDRADHLNSGLF